jgi:ribosomal protein L40E
MIGGPLGALRVLAAVYIFFDSNRRGFGLISSILLSLGALYVPLVVVPLYLLFKVMPIKVSTNMGGFASKNTSKEEQHVLTRGALCPKCGSENPVGTDICRQCQNHLTL